MAYLKVVRDANAIKLFRCKTIKCSLLIMLCSLLVVLGSVRQLCSNDDSSDGNRDDDSIDGNSNDDSSDSNSDEVVTEEIAYIDEGGWCKSTIMTNRLLAFGFRLSSENQVVQIKPYTPEETVPALSVPDNITNPSLMNSTEKTTSYIVKCPESKLTVISPEVNDVHQLCLNLAKLKDVAVIRLTKVQFKCKANFASSYTALLHVISRIVNMLECESLELKLLESETISHYTSPGLESSLEEIRKANRYVGSNSKYSLIIDDDDFYQYLPNLKDLGIPLLRLISNLTLWYAEVTLDHYLPWLPLANNYTLCLRELGSTNHIDFVALHNQNIKCRKIIVLNMLANLTLVGLENATADIHPKITLELYWRNLRYLCYYNESKISVYSIIAMASDPLDDVVASMLLQVDSSPTCRVITTKLTTQAPGAKHCCVEDKGTQYCRKRACAKEGISFKRYTVEYISGCGGLLDTLKVLKYDLHALYNTSIEDLKSKGVKCPGKVRRGKMWKLQEPVNLQLKIVELMYQSRSYGQKKKPAPFCQNIHYTTINISGPPISEHRIVVSCQDLLDRFVNITASKLKIANVYSEYADMIECSLSNKGENNQASKRPRRHLNLETLVLDNVDNQIISKLLNEYTFVSPVEVHILNQRYPNLEIAWILSHPIGQKITKLVLNGFVDLNDVKYYEEYKKEDRLAELPLFKYIETMKAKDKSDPATGLGLNRLILQLEGVNCSKYTEVLAEFEKLGIRCQVVPFAAYVNRPIDKYKEYLMAATQYSLENSEFEIKQQLQLYDINLKDLEADLIDRYEKATLEANSNHSQKPPIQKTPVNDLSLYFCEDQFLTEKDFVNILRWIACQFTDVKTLILYNLKTSDDEQNIISSCNYFTAGLDTLEFIEIRDGKQDIQLKTHTTHNIRLAEFTTYKPGILVMEHTMLPRILGQNLAEMNPESCLYK
ncbi:hypothetical protein NEHOM01_1891, partial [Nematocida homosporus]|uniref:uncharacterized protein n=1 Tax=Nematocida homosporus TaxID=1912981 RepID=UPI00221EB0FB